MKGCLFPLALTLAAGAALAGPVDGPTTEKLEVPSSRPNAVGEADLTRVFRGGQRATVVVIGDHNPVADLEVRVYEVKGDSEGKLIAHDGGKASRDIVGVSWVPARTGPYRIVIRNPAPLTEKNPFNRCYVVLR